MTGQRALHGIGIGLGLLLLLAILLVAGPAPGVAHAGDPARPLAVAGGPLFVNQGDPHSIDQGCTRDYPCGKVWEAMSLVTATRNTLYIGAGNYTGVGGAVITVTQNLTVYGGWNGLPTDPAVCDPAAYRTVLDGEGKRRVIYVKSFADAKVDGLTIARGWAGAGSPNAGNGGGVYVDVASITLSRDVITGSTSASYGGGIYADVSVTMITACQVLSNSAQYGGGGACASGSFIGVQNSIFQQNKANYGAALDASSAFASLWASVISHNRGPSAVSFSCGVGPYFAGATNCVVAHNQGSAFDATGMPLRLTYNTIADNGNIGAVAFHATVTLTDNILAGNVGKGAEAWEGGSLAGSHNLFYQNDLGDDWTGSNPVFGDPAFVNAAADDYHLGAGSAAVDQGVAVPGILVDKDGWRRPIGAAPDIGAYERPRHAYLPLVLRN